MTIGNRQKNPSNANSKYKTVRYKGIKVYYLPKLHGGGMDFGQDFISEVREKFGKVNKLCEFACGPGFIGFSLLAHGLCKKLCLIDVNPLAIKLVRKTIKSNHLEGICTTYVSDVLSGVPNKEKWDLVVGNPPFFNGNLDEYKEDIIGIDPNWRIHKRFYKDISKHLNKKGAILFVETLDGSDPKIWPEMINKNGLTFIKAYKKDPNILKLFKRILKVIYTIRWSDVKRYFEIYRTHKNIKKLTQKVYSTYFVLSQKL